MSNLYLKLNFYLLFNYINCVDQTLSITISIISILPTILIVEKIFNFFNCFNFTNYYYCRKDLQLFQLFQFYQLLLLQKRPSIISIISILPTIIIVEKIWSGFELGPGLGLGLGPLRIIEIIDKVEIIEGILVFYKFIIIKYLKVDIIDS